MLIKMSVRFTYNVVYIIAGSCSFLKNSFIDIYSAKDTIHLFEVHSSAFSSIFKELCNYHQNLILNILTSYKKSHTHRQPFPIPLPSLPSPPKPWIYLLSITIVMPILHISIKWIYTECCPLWLVFFTYHHAFKIHPYCSIISVQLSCSVMSDTLQPHGL